MKKLILTAISLLFTVLSFSQSIIIEFHDFESFSCENVLNIKHPIQVLYDSSVKMYNSQPCDIKYEILIEEKIILFFNHGDLVNSAHLQSFKKNDTEIKFSFLLKEWNMEHEELTTVLVKFDKSSSFQTGIIYNLYNNETNGMLVKYMGVTE